MKNHIGDCTRNYISPRERKACPPTAGKPARKPLNGRQEPFGESWQSPVCSRASPVYPPVEGRRVGDQIHHSFTASLQHLSSVASAKKDCVTASQKNEQPVGWFYKLNTYLEINKKIFAVSDKNRQTHKI